MAALVLACTAAPQAPVGLANGFAEPRRIAVAEVGQHVFMAQVAGPTRFFVEWGGADVRLSVRDQTGNDLPLATADGVISFDREASGRLTLVVHGLDAPTTLTIRSCPRGPQIAVAAQATLARALAVLPTDRVAASRQLTAVVRDALAGAELAHVAEFAPLLLAVHGADDELLSAQVSVDYLRRLIEFYAAVAPQALVVAQLHEHLATAWLHLRRPAKANAALDAALAVVVTNRGASAPLVRRSIDLTRARMLLQAGRHRAALDLAGPLPEPLPETLPAPNPGDTVAVRCRLIHASVAANQGQREPALELVRPILADQRAPASAALRARLIVAQVALAATDVEPKITSLTDVVEHAELMLSPDSTWLAELRWTLGLNLEKRAGRAAAEQALELFEVAEAAWSACPDASPFHVASRRHDLAQSLIQLGDYANARRVFADGLAHFEARHDAETPAADRADLARSLRLGVAYADSRLDRWQEAESAVQALLAEPAETPRQRLVRVSATELHATLLRLYAKPQQAVEVVRTCLAEFERQVPGYLRRRLYATLATALYEVGDLAAAAEAEAEARGVPAAELLLHEPKYLVDVAAGDRLADVLEARLVEAATAVQSARATHGTGKLRETLHQVCRALDDQFTSLAVVARNASDRAASLEAQLLELTEAVRLSRTPAHRIRQVLREYGDGLDAELRQLVVAVDTANAEIAAAYAQAPNQVLRCVRRRDDAEAKLIEGLVARGRLPAPARPSVAAIAATLAPHEAAVAYWRYFHCETNAGEGKSPVRWTHYVAFVILPDGTLTRIPLGRSDVVEQAGQAWRARDHEGADVAAGEVLRVALLDPVTDLLRRRGVVGAKVTTLRIAAEEEIGLVPFDSLPDGEHRVVGDRLTITFVPSLSQLAVRRQPASKPRLVTLAGVDFAGLPVALGTALRSGSDGKLRPLTESAAEARLVESTFRGYYPGATICSLRGAGASKHALLTEVRNASHVHLATHAWFAPSWLTQRDPTARPAIPIAELGSGARQLDYVSRQSPLSLCGLAVSGADAADPRVRSHGVVTGEEIAGLDLSGCELAVLSACCTSLGVYAPQSGVASFQNALHTAGVANTITALWPVPDLATRELMSRFYSNLWTKRMTIVESLAHAKRSMREEIGPDGKRRYEARVWAAFVLSGRGD